MTDRPTLEDLDAAPDDGPWCCNGNAEDCALCTDPNPNYPWICPGHERTAANERLVGEATQTTDPCGGRVCAGSDCSHERAATELTRLDQHLGYELTASEREQQLIDAHRATIGELRAAQGRIRLLEAELEAAADRAKEGQS